MVIILKFKNWLKKHFSLRLMLSLLILFVGLSCDFVIMEGMRNYAREMALKGKETEIYNQAVTMSNLILSQEYLLQPEENPAMSFRLEQMASDVGGRVLVVNGAFTVIKDTYAVETGKTMVLPKAMEVYRSKSYRLTRDEERGTISLVLPVLGSDKQVRGIMVVTAFLDQLLDNFLSFEKRLNLFATIVAVVIVLLAIFVPVLMVRPLNSLERYMDHISISESQLLEVHSYAELDSVVASFNKMLKKMEALDQSRQEFVSNVSHELKTPITSMRILADSLIGAENAPIELYQEFMSDISDEVDREAKIIDDLLSLVRMDKARTQLKLANTSINEMLEKLMKRLRPIAQTRNVDLVLESFRPVLADVDEVKLSLALTNLVENAIKYNNDGGFVHVTLNADTKYFYVKVADSGIGIPEDAVDHIFERFYRVDKARSRETGGTGLGLAITHSVVDMHKGEIKVYSKPGEGTTFTVRIPLTFVKG